MAMRRLGQILVDLGFITDDQLEQLLEDHQASPGILIGKFAESQNLINEEQLAQALAEQWGMQVVNLADIVVPPNVLSMVTETMAQMYRIIPIAFRDDTLTIALCDPQNLSIQDELRTFLGYDIRSVVATERDVLKALERYYASSSESVESLVQDLDTTWNSPPRPPRPAKRVPST